MKSDVFVHGGQRTTSHPAERAISAWGLFVDLLPDGVILDPFLGTGTTLRACKDRGRPAIGIELNEAFCHKAAERCAQETLFVV